MPIRPLALAVGACLAAVAHGQAAPVPEDAAATDAPTAEAVADGRSGPDAPAPAAPPPYRDRIISADRLPPLPPDEDAAGDGRDADGPPRSLRVDAGASRNERGPLRYDEYGLSASGFWESERWGGFSLDGGLFHSDRPRYPGDAGGLGGTLTLWQRDLAVDGGWRVDNGLGVLNSPVLPIERAQYRFFLPSVPLAGVSSQWRDDATGLLVQGAFGRAGSYTGTRAIGFDAADGRVVSLGSQWRWAPGWTGAASYLATFGRIVPGELGEPVFQPGDARALHLATGWAGVRDALQFNLLGSDGSAGAAEGAWLDGRSVRGRYEHHYGAFRFDPGLAWGAYPIQNDVDGAYYRLAYQYGRWSWTVGGDALQSVSGRGADTRYATGYLRYQASSTLGYGGSLNLRQSPELSHSAQLFADKRTDLGQTRVQLDEARARGGDSWQLSVDHAFALRQGARLSASAAYGQLGQVAFESDGTGRQAGTTRSGTFALYGGRDLTDRLSLDGSLRWTHGSGRDAVRGLDLNLNADWALAPHWSLNAAVFQSQGSRRSPFVLDPLVTGTPYVALPRERSVLLTLRYDVQAGSARTVIGGPPGAAFGTVQGTVFLDENADGVRAASELPAANVTVLLDGRYSVRTDAAGHYEFPRVAVGTHTLQVEPDNLPLPWSFEGDGARRQVTVGVRDDARVDLGARRPR